MPCALNCYCPYRPSSLLTRNVTLKFLAYFTLLSRLKSFALDLTPHMKLSYRLLQLNGLGCKTVLNADISRDHYSINSFVRGHHVYKEEWILTVSESLNCVREPLNEKDKNAGAVIRDD